MPICAYFVAAVGCFFKGELPEDAAEDAATEAPFEEVVADEPVEEIAADDAIETTEE